MYLLLRQKDKALYQVVGACGFNIRELHLQLDEGSTKDSSAVDIRQFNTIIDTSMHAFEWESSKECLWAWVAKEKSWGCRQLEMMHHLWGESWCWRNCGAYQGQNPQFSPPMDSRDINYQPLTRQIPRRRSTQCLIRPNYSPKAIPYLFRSEISTINGELYGKLSSESLEKSLIRKFQTNDDANVGKTSRFHMYALATVASSWVVESPNDTSRWGESRKCPWLPWLGIILKDYLELESLSSSLGWSVENPGVSYTSRSLELVNFDIFQEKVWTLIRWESLILRSFIEFPISYSSTRNSGWRLWAIDILHIVFTFKH